MDLKHHPAGYRQVEARQDIPPNARRESSPLRCFPRYSPVRPHGIMRASIALSPSASNRRVTMSA